ncbi:DNA helicase-2 / ATP-dependent DNA helicase PcrA [Mesobacillus persicus]|uniref:DNA helicase-2 / ATP-dependent DNA helicase PcrA n=1 Tax=Mesobacillus persicus TaxID=930146 RepID=A0A1H8JIH4_9BACI|nr:RNA polymerase recycling motor HelD [Mesobacillus persicus]SEN80540.1 DNA helicase-2 / ATP-dependent DNA helicase PcrA [Mesobacillus persicus]
MKNDKIASVFDHPDYQAEVEYLEFTKVYINMILESSTGNKENFKENIKQAFVDLDYLDSSLSYINILTNAKFLEMAETQLGRLQSILNNPYFARINFQREVDGKEELLYIGKTSLYDRENQLPIIIDWRSPIANVYYDGRLGTVSYEVNEEEREGYLSLKRQYKIEDGMLKDIRDVDLTTHDELLQESLAGKADNRLTEIVSTIQKEQNDVIRASLQHPIIVQGAAGSGKTTIALHRISYFLYIAGENFQPEKLMILAPNRLFIDYISDVLPELGVDKIKQTTFVDYMKACLGEKIKIAPTNDKLLSLVEGAENADNIKWISSYKGSLAFRDLLDKYLKDIEKSTAPSEDFMLEKYRLKKGENLKRLFLKEYKYLPIYNRLDKIKGLLSNHLKTKKKMILTKLEEKYDDALEKALYNMKDASKRKKKVSHLLDQKEQRLETIKAEGKVAVKNYMKMFKPSNIFTLYKELMTSPVKLMDYSSLNESEATQLSTYCTHLFKKKVFELEDLAPLYYLKTKLTGIDDEYKMKSFFIDEAQDYSYFQLFALKEGSGTDLFTIVGDLAQGIHSYRGNNSWEPVLKDIFPSANYHSLRKSYRTTVEIMELANDVLAVMKEDLPRVEPVVRHGPKPIFAQVNPKNTNELVTLLKKNVDELYKQDLNSIAIIGRTEKECKVLANLLGASDVKTQLLDEMMDMKKGYVSIVPSYLSKGLEFDAVIMVALNEKYTNEELDIKLLYVAMTRPMHRLYLYGRAPSDFLLDEVNENHYQVMD